MQQVRTHNPDVGKTLVHTERRGGRQSSVGRLNVKKGNIDPKKVMTNNKAISYFDVGKSNGKHRNMDKLSWTTVYKSLSKKRSWK